jgi:hypothetical protein
MLAIDYEILLICGYTQRILILHGRKIWQRDIYHLEVTLANIVRVKLYSKWGWGKGKVGRLALDKSRKLFN